MSGLFAAKDELQLMPLPDAEVYYLPSLELGRSPAELMNELISTVSWREERIVVWGRSHPQPRLIAWFGDVGKSYTYSGISLMPTPWTPTLQDVKHRVEAVARTQFNSVLLNYYRNERDSMGFHSDDEPELGCRPTIASLSLGEIRTFQFKHKFRAAKPKRIRLESGSLLLMKGDTQLNWKHGIARETRPCGPRVNLTFRQILS